MEEIIKRLKQFQTFKEYLEYIKATDGLRMCQDNGWYWLEYKGEEVEGSAGEKFISSSDMQDLMNLAGI
jgi:hypothetical protein